MHNAFCTAKNTYYMKKTNPTPKTNLLVQRIANFESQNTPLSMVVKPLDYEDTRYVLVNHLSVHLGQSLHNFMSS